MKIKIYKYLKSIICLGLICSLVAPSYASLSASDGSAFVTKEEFDSALSDFNARLTTFEAGINSKIDSQVTSYLDRNGIWSGKEQITVDKSKECTKYLYVNCEQLNTNGTVTEKTEKFKINNVEYKKDTSLPTNFYSTTFSGGITSTLFSTRKSFLKPNKSGLMCLSSEWRAPSYWTKDANDRFYYFTDFVKLKFNGNNVIGYDALYNNKGYWYDNVWTNNRENDWRIRNDTDNISLLVTKKTESGTYDEKLQKSIGKIIIVNDLNNMGSGTDYRFGELIKIKWGKAYDYYFVSKNDDLYLEMKWEHTCNTTGSAGEWDVMKNYLVYSSLGGVMWYVDSASVY